MAKEFLVVATFRSSSNGRVWYRVNRDENGALSCTCPGWCRKVGPDGSRTCKHVVKVLEHEADPKAKPIRRSRSAPDAESPGLGRRRFRL